MLIGILIGWFILVFGAYAFCIVQGIDPMFYLWLAFAVIGGIFVCMDGFDFYMGSPSRQGPVQISIEHGKQGVKNRQKEASKNSRISDLLSYMTIPLILCLVCEYLIF